MKIKTASIRVKAGPEDGLEDGQFLLYASTFTDQPDSYGDVVVPGAFANDIAEWKASDNVMPVLYGHRMDDPDFFVGGVLEMSEDDHGYLIKGEFDLENPKAQQVYRLAKGKRLNQCSFAYDTLDEATVTRTDGTKVNELRKLKVYEVSIVPVGANQDTEVLAVKAVTDYLTAGVKAGRVLAQKHIDSLRSAQEAIGAVITAAEADQEKASGTGDVKDEEPDRVKSEEPNPNPSARALAELHLLTLV
jgi:HK97 family phage prohead protease